MTVVEFYSADPIENIASLVALRPERVIVLCAELPSEDVQTRYATFVSEVQPSTLWEFRVWNGGAEAMEASLESLLLTEKDVRVDLTGGSEVALWIAGRISCRQNGVRMHRFDLIAGKAYAFPSGEVLPLVQPLTVTVAQCVALHGGKTGGAANGRAMREWTLTPELEQAVKATWAAYVERGQQWNNDMRDFLLRVSHRSYSTDPLEVMMDDNAPAVRGKSTARRDRFLECLNRRGVIHLLKPNHFRYVSQEAKECLGKEGDILELHTLVTALLAKDSDGNPMFCDARNGVYIDWNGKFDEAGNAHNEMDVLLMSGVRPVFISCKSGEIGREEVYMLRALADRFGGKRAIAALVVNDAQTEAFAKRTDHMNIRFIQQAYRIDSQMFREQLCQWVQGT